MSERCFAFPRDHFAQLMFGVPPVSSDVSERGKVHLNLRWLVSWCFRLCLVFFVLGAQALALVRINLFVDVMPERSLDFVRGQQAAVRAAVENLTCDIGIARMVGRMIGTGEFNETDRRLSSSSESKGMHLASLNTSPQLHTHWFLMESSRFVHLHRTLSRMAARLPEARSERH